MDETYLKLKGEDIYLYRVVDKDGATIDFMLSKKRDKNAVFSFLSKEIGRNGFPEKVTIDGSAASKSGLTIMNMLLMMTCFFGKIFYQFLLCQIKYLNNIVEQDHRFIKWLTKRMLGFKEWGAAKPPLPALNCIIC